MKACLSCPRHRLFRLGDRRAQARSTLFAPFTLYSATMSQLEVARPDQLMLLRTARAALHAHRDRPSTVYRNLLAGRGGLKMHSLTGRGFVQQGLSAIRHHTAAGRA